MSAIRYDSRVVQRVRDLHTAGWSHRRIHELMREENGHAPSCETIARWLNPKYAEASRARVRRRELRVRSESWAFLLPGPGNRQTVAYQAAFVRRLRGEGVPVVSIARVCSVVFGEPWTRHRVDTMLAMEAPA